MTVVSRQGRAYTREEITALLRVALAQEMADGASFRDLSLERLCGRAGVARSTFYLYFADKSAMLDALTGDLLLRLYAAQRAWLAKGQEATLADVRAAMRASFATFRGEEGVARALAEAAAYDPRTRQAYTDAIGDYVRALERFIRAGQRGGWARDVHPRATATALAWMVERTVSQIGSTGSAHQARTAADALTDAVCAILFGTGQPSVEADQRPGRVPR